jgi:hypothetical protein
MKIRSLLLDLLRKDDEGGGQIFFANAGKTSVTCNSETVHTEFREDQPLEIHRIKI